MRTFVDTNVLVYAFDRGEPDKQARAQSLLAQTQPHRLVISAQVLNEFYVTVTGKLDTPMPQAEAAAAVGDLAASIEVVPVDALVVEAAVATSIEDQLSLWDAMIVEAARAGGCDVLLTEDLNHGQSHGGIMVHDPFRGESFPQT